MSNKINVDKVYDSLELELENETLPLLGTLQNSFLGHEPAIESAKFNEIIYDSDETRLSCSSLASTELSLTATCQADDNSQDLLELGINSDNAIPSQSLLPESQLNLTNNQSTNSTNNMDVTTGSSLVSNTSAKDTTQTPPINNPVTVSIPKKRKKKRQSVFIKKKPFLKQAKQVTSYKKSQKTKQKDHCSQMEELNTIEAKLLSVQKLIASEKRKFVEEAEKRMLDVEKRIGRAKMDIHKHENPVKNSDSSSENEENQQDLISVRQSRLDLIFTKHQDLKYKLLQALSNKNLIESETDSLNCSQSIIPTSFLQAFDEVVVLNQNTKRPSQTPFTKTTSIENTICNNSQTVCNLQNKNKTKQFFVKITPNSVSVSNQTTNPTYPKIRSTQKGLFERKIPNYSLVSKNNKKKHPRIIFHVPDLITNSTNTVTSSAKDMMSSNTVVMTSSVCLPQQVAPIMTPLEPAVTSLSCVVTSPDEVMTSSIPRPFVRLSSQPKPTTGPVWTIDLTNEVTLLPLSLMLERGLIKRGQNVLHFKERNAYCSVVGKAKIVGGDFMIYNSLQEWIKQLTEVTFSIKNIFKMVFYNNLSLFDISSNFQKFTSTEISLEEKKMQEFFTPNNFVGYLRTCTVKLPTVNDFFVTSSLLDCDVTEETTIWKLLANSS